jgi:DNA-binding MarR family transcriptional regulator
MSTSLNLDDQVVTALRRIARAIDLHSRDLLQQCGLTAPQLLTLRALFQLGSSAVSALATAICVSQATMTGILDRLELRGFVARTRGQDDRRSTLVTLTAAGGDFLGTAPSTLQDHFRDELSKLETWEQTAILSTLQRIAAMMGTDRLTAAPILVGGAEGLADEDS